MEIEFKGFYSREDVFKAVFLANKPTKKRELIRIGVSSLAMVIYIAYTVLASIQNKTPLLDPNMIGSHVLYILLIVLFLYYPNITSAITAFKIWRAPTMRYEYRGNLSSEGVLYSGKKTLITWDQIVQKQVTDEIIVLLTGNGILSFFPRGFFKSEGDWQRATQLVEFNLSEVN
ncbi:MAG: hypothetical protein CVU42_03395 [Chloroflexi bacterium HGW-Chloroflexi-4]|jgi:hypothetical protein|nr:MAG: hypothetical protein CVU42_03395 [Chloroflexi bacterium HGW-Chloroflexi-4]